MAKPTKVIAGFPSTRRGEFTLLKTDPKRELLAYALDRAVVLRPLLPTDKPTLLYTEHSYPVTSLEFAPSGSYVASGDASGVVRVWACDNPDLILKLESPMLGGPVLDLAWSGDSQRIVAVGEGREAKGKVVMWDSGNSVGDISGHTKKINSVAFKPNRPFRIVTGGEEGNVNIHHGPPFKFAGRIREHTRFVNVVRYSPDGARVLSASSDMSLAVYDGKDGSEAASKKLHQGSIFGAAWSPDSARIATASADKTVGIFDATTLDEVAAVSLGTRVEDMQVGCVWMAEGIVSYSLGGALSIVDPANPSAPPRVQVGHNRPIASGVYAPSVGRYITGSFASISDSAAPRGVMRSWDLGEGVAAPFAGETEHSSRIVKMVLTAAGSLVSVGLDDAAVWSNVSPPAAYAKVALDACPTDLSAGGDLCLALTANSEVVVLGAAKVDARQKLAFDATCLAVAPSGASVAVGSSDHTVWLYAPADGKLTNERALAGHKGPITCAAFSTDSIKLATGSAAKEIIVWEAASGAPLVTGLNGYHTSSVRCLAWSSAGRLASGGVDGSLVLWTQEGTKVGTKVSNAHAGGVNTISWLSADAVVSAGGDCAIKTWQA